MDRRSIASRAIWVMAVIVGIGYWFGSLARSGIAFHDLALLPKSFIVGWKGASALLLAISVLLSSRGRPALLIGAALAISAVSDMLLVTSHMIAGGAGFALAHTLAITAYISHRDDGVGWLRMLWAFAVPVTAVALSYFAIAGSGRSTMLALFPILSGTMAASAIFSRFPLWLNGLGATIFVASDVLFLLDIGLLGGGGQLGFLTWATYFCGYAMVAKGAVIHGAKASEAGG